uniref:Uncharacterized protein n=1 Tax=Oryza brachyantha TaxID=4533 RepID=J3KY30_ORYBR
FSHFPALAPSNCNHSSQGPLNRNRQAAPCMTRLTTVTREEKTSVDHCMRQERAYNGLRLISCEIVTILLV